MMATYPRFSLHEFYDGPIRERLAIAQGLYPDLVRELPAKEAFGRQLAQALISQKEVAQAMTDLDLGGLCGVCGAKPGGGCCSSFMAGENDVVQLLLNLLAGVAVRVFREDAECCFLGERGCPLLFKPMFCLNYNCQQIIRSAASDRMRNLEQRVGRLLQQQYGLEQLLLEFLRQRGTLSG